MKKLLLIALCTINTYKIQSFANISEKLFIGTSNTKPLIPFHLTAIAIGFEYATLHSLYRISTKQPTNFQKNYLYGSIAVYCGLRLIKPYLHCIENPYFIWLNQSKPYSKEDNIKKIIQSKIQSQQLLKE